MTRKGVITKAVIICPECGYLGSVDGDQFAGRVSVLCPVCGYHETHDLRQLQRKKAGPRQVATQTPARGAADTTPPRGPAANRQ